MVTLARTFWRALFGGYDNCGTVGYQKGRPLERVSVLEIVTFRSRPKWISSGFFFKQTTFCLDATYGSIIRRLDERCRDSEF